MNTIAACCAFGLLGAFIAIRNPRVFILFGGGVLGTAMFYARVSAMTATSGIFDLLLLVSGGGALLVGLWFVRVMLKRSVSLHALVAASRIAAGDESSITEQLEHQMRSEIHARLDDLKRYRLVDCADGVLGLTLRGRIVTGVVAFLNIFVRS